MSEKSPKTLSKNEANRDRFIRIAERRVNKVLEELESLAKCSNRKNYSYSEEDVRRIFSEIDKKAKEAKAQFQDSSKDKKVFKLEY